MKPWRRDPARVQAALARLKFRRSPWTLFLTDDEKRRLYYEALRPTTHEQMARGVGGPTPSSHWPYF